MQALSLSRELEEVHARGVRLRLMEGLAEAVTRKGYAATTVAQIVRQARVSKRTFYEHFQDKQECFLAAYSAAAEQTMEAIVGAVNPQDAWEEQLVVATRAYFSALESKPALTRAFLLEIHAAGRRGLQMRREVNQRFADLLRTLVEASRSQRPDLAPLSQEMATAVVGGINEALLLYVEEGRADRLTELTDTAAGLLRAVLLTPPRTRPGSKGR